MISNKVKSNDNINRKTHFIIDVKTKSPELAAS